MEYTPSQPPLTPQGPTCLLHHKFLYISGQNSEGDAYIFGCGDGHEFDPTSELQLPLEGPPSL